MLRRACTTTPFFSGRSGVAVALVSALALLAGTAEARDCNRENEDARNASYRHQLADNAWRGAQYQLEQNCGDDDAYNPLCNPFRRAILEYERGARDAANALTQAVYRLKACESRLNAGPVNVPRSGRGRVGNVGPYPDRAGGGDAGRNRDRRSGDGYGNRDRRSGDDNYGNRDRNRGDRSDRQRRREDRQRNRNRRGDGHQPRDEYIYDPPQR
jgi:hypothetical protein